MVPFQITRLFGLKVAVEGLLIANAEGMQLVFKEPDQVDVLRDSKIEQIDLPWDMIEAVVCEYGVLNDQVVLQAKPTVNVRQLAGASNQAVQLQVRKRDREELKQLEKRVEEYRRGTRRDQVDDLLDDVRDFLHGGE